MDWSIDMDKTGPADLAVIVISGGVKAVGASVGVRDVDVFVFVAIVDVVVLVACLYR
jgi:hypothetical protein